MTKPCVLITGATAGIGEATARLLATEDYRLILCGRRKDRLADLQRELESLTQVTTLSFDVRDRGAVEHAIGSLEGDWRDIDILINNAGNAHGLASVDNGDIDDWDAMIDINVKGLLYVSRAVIPGMVEKGAGHIINIGSIAGKEVYPNGNVYCASKFAVDALNSGMRMDLLEKGIKVSQVAPGLVETEFSLVRFKGDTDRASKVYEGYEPLTGNDIAEVIAFIISRPDHVNISDVTVFPKAQASTTLVRTES